MVMFLYSIRDVKSGFGFPFSMQNDEVALRAFEAALHDSNSEMSKYPQDFEIWLIGAFNTETGDIDSYLPAPLERRLKKNDK